MTVAIIKSNDPRDVREAVRLLGGMERFVAEEDRVVLKPNICLGKPNSTGVVTNPEVVAEVARMVQEVGGKPVVGESPIYPLKSRSVFPRAGYCDFHDRYGFEIVHFDQEEGVHIQVPEGKRLNHQFIAKRVLQSDKLINLPIAKTHGLTTVSLGLKNIKGVVPGKQKQIVHLAGIDEGIVDLNTAIRSDLTIIDGIIGLEGEFGPPATGQTVNLGVILAADNVVEADSTMARIMGIDPKDILHIQLAADRGLGSLNGIEIRGEPVERVARSFRHYHMPGLLKKFFSDGITRFTTVFQNLNSRIRGTDLIRLRLKLGEMEVTAERCDNCRICLRACPVDAISLNGDVKINRQTCIRCFICAEVCPREVFSRR
ncbi:MAG: DUF362 domain-containing protein [Deltaproteobacteria bacterium]|nr:MAG: DUF362 domain-containing protein [Deltaproteobacteria bacterium]